MSNSNLFYRVTSFWWIPMITGLVFIGFGIWCLCNPVSSLTIMAYIFAGAIGAVGVFNLIYGFANLKNNHGWGWAVAAGIIEILCSIWLFFLPATWLVQGFIFCAGLYIIFVSINAISESLGIYRYSSFWIVWLFLLLLVSIGCACFFLAGPIFGAAVVWIYIGISFITYGCFRILLSLVIRKINKNLPPDGEPG
ncbi:MAG: DUF308 domain-containing protein [Muribaculaceae bacterium]|nr:DUF308 domain-containing protein [Muribaculaceae bacterium]